MTLMSTVLFCRLQNIKSEDWLLGKSRFTFICLQMILTLKKNTWPVPVPQIQTHWLTPRQTLNQWATLDSHFLIVWAIRGGDHSKRARCGSIAGWSGKRAGRSQRRRKSKGRIPGESSKMTGISIITSNLLHLTALISIDYYGCSRAEKNSSSHLFLLKVLLTAAAPVELVFLFLCAKTQHKTQQPLRFQ